MKDIKCVIDGTKFFLGVDALLTLDGKLILVKRRFPPFKGSWVLPGGLVWIKETLEEAVTREVKEETGVDCEIENLIGVFSNPNRDPRGRAISACFKCKALNPPLKETEETEEVKLFSLNSLPELGFDHYEMVMAFKRVGQER